jgi:hypothetical protein
MEQTVCLIFIRLSEKIRILAVPVGCGHSRLKIVQGGWALTDDVRWRGRFQQIFTSLRLARFIINPFKKHSQKTLR